jgi:hypothetical protein
MSYENWCKYYNGIPSETCNAGVSYKDVKGQERRPLNYPCFKDSGCTVVCHKAEFRTPEEVAEEERKASEVVRKFVENLNNDICPHCENPIKEKRQVRRSVYGYPCGHRLYQGKLKERKV